MERGIFLSKYRRELKQLAADQYKYAITAASTVRCVAHITNELFLCMDNQSFSNINDSAKTKVVTAFELRLCKYITYCDRSDLLQYNTFFINSPLLYRTYFMFLYD